MTYLLDTHTLLWFLLAPERLSVRTRDLIENPASKLVVSLVTPWEIALKVAVGKLEAGEILDDFDAIMERGRFTLLLPTVAQVIRSSRLLLHHRDPFDRLLAAQAMDLGWTILSKDASFDAYGVKRLWA
jgi:PIN domain nuclease of toxin-antitoxin system